MTAGGGVGEGTARRAPTRSRWRAACVTALLCLAVTAARAAAEAFPVILASYTTEYPETPAQNAGRAWNIALATRHLDGIVLAPGETLSFNDRVGPRGLGEGFRRAPELLDGDRVEGIGGGVCQVASTLYAAALDAGLRIAARAPHSRPATYAPPGRDATVSYESVIDLKLTNDLPFPVRIAARAAAGRLTFELRAPRAADRTVSVGFERDRDAAAAALRVVTVRTITQKDGAVQREVVAIDTYH
jgi:vancomycin resistance protein YoaR